MFSLQIDVPQRYRLSFDKKRVRQILQRGGSEIAAVARRKIRTAAGAGRVYRGSGGSKYRPYVKGQYRASAPGQPPVNITGTLANSIKAKVFRSGDGVSIRDAAFYSLFLEKGAHGGAPGRRNKVTRLGGVRTIYPVGQRVLEARPFLSEALQERGPSLDRRIKEAIIDDVQFRRIAASGTP